MTFKEFISLKWFKESHRSLHFTCGIGVGFFFTIFGALGCAGGMEFKDRQWGGKWDWLDFISTVAGGVVGQAIQIFVLYFLMNVQ